MAANVVDVFIHAIEHTGTENKHVSIPLAKVKAFFFSWTKRKLFDQVSPEQSC